MKKQVLLAGGDARTPYIGELLKKNNYEVTIYGFEKQPMLPLEINVTNHPTQSDILILPIPCTKDGKTLNAPYAIQPIFWEPLVEQCKPKYVFAGAVPEQLADYFSQQKIHCSDYTKSSDFALKNALPTAEATIEIIMKNTPCVLENTHICVVGFGRIGKILAKKLQSLGCNVTATARRDEQLAEIKKIGYTPLHTNYLQTASDFDVIVNTIPALVITHNVLQKQRKDTLIIDLASKPGGVDFTYAQEKGLKTIHALSLPAKYAPKTAGNIVAKTILNYLNETE